MTFSQNNSKLTHPSTWWTETEAATCVQGSKILINNHWTKNNSFHFNNFVFFVPKEAIYKKPTTTIQFAQGWRSVTTIRPFTFWQLSPECAWIHHHYHWLSQLCTVCQCLVLLSPRRLLTQHLQKSHFFTHTIGSTLGFATTIAMLAHSLTENPPPSSFNF